MLFGQLGKPRMTHSANCSTANPTPSMPSICWSNFEKHHYVDFIMSFIVLDVCSRRSFYCCTLLSSPWPPPQITTMQLYNLKKVKICSRFLCSKWIFRCVPIGQKTLLDGRGEPPELESFKWQPQVWIATTMLHSGYGCSVSIHLDPLVVIKALISRIKKAKTLSRQAWLMAPWCAWNVLVNTEVLELGISNRVCESVFCGAWDGGNFAIKKWVLLCFFYWSLLMLWRLHCTSVYKEVDVGLGWNSFNWSDKFLVGEIERDERGDRSVCLFVQYQQSTLNLCVLSATVLCLLLRVFAHTKIVPTTGMCCKLEWWPYGTSSKVHYYSL